MNTLKFALLSLMMVSQMTPNVVTGAAIRKQDIRGSKERIGLIAAVNKSTNFTCNKPQPRSYHLGDLIPSITTAEVSKPTYIVVMRCDTFSGCCNNLELSCEPKISDYQEIEIEFRGLESGTTTRWIKVEQHTSCVCKGSDDSSARTESVMRQPNVTFVK